MPTKDKPRIVVVGSVNMDMVVRCPHLPAAGETILGTDLVSHPGGKGANQAVAAARLGADCLIVGRVGDDAFGERLGRQLTFNGVSTDHLIVTERKPSGVALIVVDQRGENSIVVASGANAVVTPQDIDAAESAIASADVLLLQLELPIATVVRAIQVGRAHKVLVVLDPGPAVDRLPAGACDVDVINPNQVEAARIAGTPIREDPHSAKLVATELIRLGARAAVVKLGRRGAVAVDGEDGRVVEVKAYDVPVVDTTAAGDAFAAALAFGLGRGMPLAGATDFAAAAGALACTHIGAMNAMPTIYEVNELMATRRV